MMLDDLDYFRRRAAEERSAAGGAADASTRDAHGQLAEAYERVLEQLESIARLKAGDAEPAPRRQRSA